MTEQAVLGNLSGYYTHRVILGQSLSLLHSLHLFEKQLLHYVIVMRKTAALRFPAVKAGKVRAPKNITLLESTGSIQPQKIF